MPGIYHDFNIWGFHGPGRGPDRDRQHWRSVPDRAGQRHSQPTRIYSDPMITMISPLGDRDRQTQAQT